MKIDLVIAATTTLGAFLAGVGYGRIREIKRIVEWLDGERELIEDES